MNKLPAIGEEIQAPAVPAPAGRPLRALPAIGAELTAPAPRPPAEDVDDRLRTLFQLGLQINPSEAAGVNYLARTLDLPPALVAQQYPLFKKSAEAVQFDPARFRRDHPGLVELLLENPRGNVHPLQAEQVSGFTRVLRGLWKAMEYSDTFEPLQGGSIEELRASAMEQASAREAAGRDLPAAPDPLPPLKQVATVQSPLKGRTGLNTTGAILAAEGRRGLLGVELGDVGFAMMVAEQRGEDPEILRRRAIEIQQELGVQVDYGAGRVEQVLVDATGAVTSQYAPLREGGKGYAIGAGLMGAAALAGTRSPTTAARAAHFGGMLLGRVGFSYGSFKQEAGSTYVTLLDEKLDDGTPLDRDTARGLSFLYGVAAAAVETASFGVLAKSLGPLKEMIARGEGRAALRAWLGDRSKREILKQVGAQWARSAASEGLEEGVQTTLQHAITWAGKSAEAGAAQDFDADAFATELGESIYKGALGGAAMATPGTAVSGAARLQHLERSRRNGHVVAELAKLAGTEAALGAPRAVAELVTREARRAGAGEISAVYLDAEAAETFFQTQGTTAGEALSELLGRDVRPAVEAARAGANLGRIEVPLPEYLEKLGPTRVAEALVGDTAVRPFDATLREQAKATEDMWAEAQDAVQLWQTTGKTPEPEPGEIEWAKRIAAKAAASGAAPKADAKRMEQVSRAFVRTAVKRYGDAARTLLQRYVVEVRPADATPPLAEEQAGLAQPAGAAAAPGAEERLAQASPGGVDVLRSGDVLVLEHPESPLRLTARDEGDAVVAELLGFQEGVPEHVETIRAHGGRGYSTALYLRALEEARAAGKGFASDAIRTGATERMYGRLRELGVPFEMDREGGRWAVSAEALAAVDLDRAWRTLLAETEIKAMREGVKLSARGRDAREQGWTRFYRVARKGLRQLFQVATTPDADASTLLHESAHVFLEILGDLAEEKAAPASARDEYSRVLEWLGVERRDAITREHHERWADAFESYLYEGRPPSVRLAGVFARMHAWFLRVGRQLRGARAPLNDEIRGLFDRMLATDEEIAAVREQAAAGDEADIFPSAEAAGLTPEQFDEYLAAKERTFADARVRVQQRLLAEQQVANERAVKAARKTSTERAEEEFAALRESRVLRFLRQGDAFGNPALRALQEEAREQESREATKVEIPEELKAKLAELDRRERAIEESGGRRRTLVVVSGEWEVLGRNDGQGVPTNRVPLFNVEVEPYEGQRLEPTQQVRILRLPAWLSDAEYLRDREGWELALRAGWEYLPQAEVRWLHGLVKDGDLAKAWAAGRILGASQLTEYQEKLAKQIRGWLGTPASARIYESPLAPSQWETIAGGRARQRFRRWEISTRRTIKDNVLGLGEAVEPGEAPDAAVALREEGSDQEALLAEIAAARDALDAEVAAARVAAQRGRVKLELQAVVDAVGTEEAERAFRGITRPDGGMPPDRIAEVFGFETGEEMLRAIAALPERDAWVEARRDELLSRDFPTLLQERDQLRQAVADAAHAKGDLEYYLKQWAILRSKAGDRGAPPLAALERAAEGIVRGKQAGKLNLRLALDAEMGAGRRAAEAAARGNWRQAAVYLQQQILSNRIYKFMQEARKDRDELERMAKTMAPDKYRAQIGRTSPAIRDAIDQILEAVGLRERVQRDAPPLPISEAVRAMEDFGISVLFDQELVERLLRQPLLHGELLVSDMRKVRDALANLRAAAHSQEEVIDGEKRADVDAAVHELQMEAERSQPLLPPAKEKRAQNTAERLSGFGATVHGEVLRVSTMIDWLGGRDTRSAWHRLVLAPLQAAKHQEVDLLDGPFRKVIEAFEKMPAEMRRRATQKVDGAALFPTHRGDLVPPTRRFQLLMMALNAGNQSNLDRLLEGRGISEAQLDAALGQLTAAELEWVQQVWDACEALWPLSRAMEERVAGLAPPKIEAKPRTVSSRDGKVVHLRGGYFPAVYVREVTTAGEKQALEKIKDVLSPGFIRPGTPHSHLKGRVDGFVDALALDPDAIVRHLTQVAHDLAFREPLQSVARLLMDERVQQTLKQRLGPERSPQFLQWLKDIGSMRAAENAAAASGLVKGARRLRSNLAVGVLGYAADVAAGDVMNLFVAALATPLKAKWLARGLAEVVAHPWRTVEWTGKKSGELRYRRARAAEEARRRIDGMTSRSPLKRGALERFKRFAFVFQEALDLATSTPIWAGAFHQGLEQGRTEEEAIAFADRVVEKVFPSAHAVDAAFMARRKDALELFQMFQGYASVLANLYLDRAHQIHEAKAPTGKARRAVEFIGFAVALGTVASVAADAIMGKGPADQDDDDELSGEEWADWYVERLLLGWAYVIPVFGWVGEAGVSTVKGKLETDSWTAGQASPRTAPIFSALQSSARAAQKAIAAAQEEELTEAELIELLKAAGMLAGVPATRPGRAVQYGVDLWQGEVEDRGPDAVLKGFVYGPPRE